MDEYVEFLKANQHLSYTLAARKLGITKQRVHQICRHHGITLTPWGRERVPSTETIDGRPCVYVIGESDSGPVKIGVSTQVGYRLECLQSGNYRQLKILFSSDFIATRREAWHIENKIHKLLNGFVIRSEWFLCSAKAAIEAINISFGHPIPDPRKPKGTKAKGASSEHMAKIRPKRSK
jgi:hypothetical protein